MQPRHMHTARHNSPAAASSLLLALLLQPLVAMARPVAACRVLNGGQVNPALATLASSTPRTTYRRGEPIRVTVTLHAGPRGIYLPDYFGDFMRSCTRGFSAILLTLDGKSADPIPVGCANASPQQWLHYVALEPGDTRKWKTTLATQRISPGHYCLYAEYLNAPASGDIILDPPSDPTLEGSGRIPAPPISVEIRKAAVP